MGGIGGVGGIEAQGVGLQGDRVVKPVLPGAKGGQVVATQEIATTGEPAAIELSVDRDTIHADRRDVAHVTVKVVDAQGRVDPDADNEIVFEVQGEGKLIGLDNGDMSSAEGYKGTQKKAFHGMCLGIVQASATAGRIRVTAASPGLTPATVTIATRA